MTFSLYREMETMQDGGIIQAENKNDKVVCFVRAAGILLGILWIPEIGLKILSLYVEPCI